MLNSYLEQLIYEDNPMFWVIEDALDSDCTLAYAPFNPTRTSSSAGHVMRFSGNWITVQDVINQFVNIEGTIRRAGKRCPGTSLQEAAKSCSHFGLPRAVNQVKLIGRITAGT